MELTEKQKDTLIFIQQYKKENDYSPSVREIGDSLEISVKAVVDRLNALEHKGYIKHDYGVARSIRILKDV